MSKGKTGGDGRPWVDLEPKPPRVPDHYDFWSEAPPEESERCKYWVRQFGRGFFPNRRVLRECYDCRAEWFGVYMWEYLNVLLPLIDAAAAAPVVRYEKEK